MGLTEKLDEFLMSSVNGLIYSWNTITGRTKTDLSQLLNGIAPAFEITGGYALHPVMGIALTSIALYSSYIMYNKFREQEADESRLRGSNTKRDYRHDFENNVYGTFFTFCSVGNFVAENLPSDSESKSTQHLPGNFLVGLGNGLRALSCYIMRADDPPPGKNIFARMLGYFTGNSLARQPIRVSRQDY